MRGLSLYLTGFGLFIAWIAICLLGVSFIATSEATPEARESPTLTPDMFDKEGRLTIEAQQKLFKDVDWEKHTTDKLPGVREHAGGRWYRLLHVLVPEQTQVVGIIEHADGTIECFKGYGEVILVQTKGWGVYDPDLMTVSYYFAVTLGTKFTMRTYVGSYYYCNSAGEPLPSQKRPTAEERKSLRKALRSGADE